MKVLNTKLKNAYLYRRSVLMEERIAAWGAKHPTPSGFKHDVMDLTMIDTILRARSAANARDQEAFDAAYAEFNEWWEREGKL